MRAAGSALTLALVLLVPAAAVVADHTEFLFKDDRFEVTGNLPGGAFDEFNDSVVAPWTVPYGTANESGGYLELSDPGVHDWAFYPILLDRSDAKSPSSFDVMDGGGSFIGTSRWALILPELPGDYIAMGLEYGGLGGGEGLGLAMANNSPEIAAAFEAQGIPTPEGLSVRQWKYYPAPPEPSITDVETVSISPGDVTGDILFRIAFNDSSNVVTTSYSLDGGQTFVSPFTPLSSALTGTASWFLSADPGEIPSWELPGLPALPTWGSLAAAAALLAAGVWTTRRLRR